jgi:RNA polymerase sigma-70 factor (ECF subfamily)
LLAYQNIKGFRADATFKTWLYRIGINQCNNFFRQNKMRDHISVDDIPVTDSKANQEGDLSDKERSAHLQKAVERLPYKQRMVVTLRIYQEFSFEEIGTALNIRTNSAKVNFHHAVEKQPVRSSRKWPAIIIKICFRPPLLNRWRPTYPNAHSAGKNMGKFTTSWLY